MTSIIFALCFLLLALPWQNYCNTSWTPISSASSTRLQPAFGEVQKCLGVGLYFFLYSSSVSVAVHVSKLPCQGEQQEKIRPKAPLKFRNHPRQMDDEIFTWLDHDFPVERLHGMTHFRID